MGIYKADVRYVYHLQPAEGDSNSHSQELGRAGRDGEPSICELFACRDDVPTLENFAFGEYADTEAIAGLLDYVFAIRRARGSPSRSSSSPPRFASAARAEDDPHLPRARRPAPSGHPVLRRLQLPAVKWLSGGLLDEVFYLYRADFLLASAGAAGEGEPDERRSRCPAT